jgi:hypothetical protein
MSARRKKELKHGITCKCGHFEPFCAYAIAQTAMGHTLQFTCPKCNKVRKRVRAL